MESVYPKLNKPTHQLRIKTFILYIPIQEITAKTIENNDLAVFELLLTKHLLLEYAIKQFVDWTISSNEYDAEVIVDDPKQNR